MTPWGDRNAGPYFQTRTLRRAGCQIDLLIRTKHTVYVFEIKFRRTVSKSVIADVREKVNQLAVDKSTTVRTGLIYQGDLDPDIATADYFDHLISFEQLLKAD